MAIYKDANYLTQDNNNVFDSSYRPGETPPYSGIYRCMGCGREIVAETQRSFPPQNHHQHSPRQNDIRWRMIVCADSREK